MFHGNESEGKHETVKGTRNRNPTVDWTDLLDFTRPYGLCRMLPAASERL